MSVLDEIRAAADQLREGEAEASANRRLSDTTWKQLHEFGVLRALQPKRWGGGELELREHLTNVYEIARFAPSIGWATGVVSSHPWQLALFPARSPRRRLGRRFGGDAHFVLVRAHGKISRAAAATPGQRPMVVLLRVRSLPVGLSRRGFVPPE